MSIGFQGMSLAEAELTWLSADRATGEERAFTMLALKRETIKTLFETSKSLVSDEDLLTFLERHVVSSFDRTTILKDLFEDGVAAKTKRVAVVGCYISNLTRRDAPEEQVEDWLMSVIPASRRRFLDPVLTYLFQHIIDG